jgi:protein tyrosine/serine phosphatase
MALSSALLLFAVPAFSQEASLRLYRVDDHVYRGPQPGHEDLATLAGRGIRTVLDLRGSIDHKRWEQTAVEAAGMKYIRIGLSGVFPPSTEQMNRILRILENPALSPVFLHCRRGADRSGMVIACYRIEHDHWTNAEAMSARTGFQRVRSPDEAVCSTLQAGNGIHAG